MRSATWLVLGSSAGAVVAALVLLPPEWIAGAEASVAAWRGWFGAVRIAGIAAAWLFWDALTGRLPGLDAGGAAYLRGRRSFWVGALAAIELVVVRNVPGAVWDLWA